MTIKISQRSKAITILLALTAQFLWTNTSYAGGSRNSGEVGRVINTVDVWMLSLKSTNNQKLENIAGIGGRELVSFGKRLDIEVEGFSGTLTAKYKSSLNSSERAASVILAKGTISLRVFNSRFSPSFGLGYGIEKVNIPYISPGSEDELDENGEVKDAVIIERGSEARPLAAVKFNYQNKRGTFFASLQGVHSFRRASQNDEVNFSMFTSISKTMLSGLQVKWHTAKEGGDEAPGYTINGYGLSLGFKIGG